MKHFISGLILAAGTSSRMGQPKQLLPFRGTILLDWVMAQAESASALDEVIVILGRAAAGSHPRLPTPVPRSSSIRSSPKGVLVPTKLVWPASTSALRP
jgi:CTP:molybdopterin cytidylyltransferase MocA